MAARYRRADRCAFLLISLLGEGFAIGVLIESAKAALGSAYDLQVPDGRGAQTYPVKWLMDWPIALKRNWTLIPAFCIRLDSGGGDQRGVSGRQDHRCP